MPQQFRTVQRTIQAEQYTGDTTALTAFCSDIRLDSDGEPLLSTDDGDVVDVDKGDWVARTMFGFARIRDDAFQREYVGARADDEQAVSFKMTTVEGRTLTATIEGWINGKDAVRAMMHIGNPKVVIEFCKEQVVAGDMSMLTLMDELAAAANPGE